MAAGFTSQGDRIGKEIQQPVAFQDGIALTVDVCPSHLNDRDLCVLYALYHCQYAV